MNHAMGIAALVLTVVLWLIYHQVVSVTYFGNMGGHIIKELFGCFIVSVFLVATLSVVAGKFFAAVGSLLVFLLKIALVIAVIGLVLWLAAAIFRAVTGKGKSKNKDSNEEGTSTASAETAETAPEAAEEVSQVPAESAEAETAAAEPGETVSVILTGADPADQIRMLRAIREITGLDLNGAKEVLNTLPKTLKENVPQDQAQALKQQLEQSGGQVTLQ